MIKIKKNALKYKDNNGDMKDLGTIFGEHITDSSLTKSGVPADAKKTGEKFTQLSDEIADQATTIKREVIDELFFGSELTDSDNHFNKDSVVANKRINANSQKIESYTAANCLISDYIEVEGGKNVYINNLPLYTSTNGSIRRILYLSEDKATTVGMSKIPHGNPQHSEVIPNGAKYMVFDVYSTIPDGSFARNLDYSQIMLTFDQYRDYAEYREPSEATIDVEFSKPTKGKQMLIFGDSITETATMNDDGSNYAEGKRVNWMTFASEMLETTNFKNYAKSGATYKDQSSGEFRQSLANQIALALADTSNDTAEIIVLSLGTNDGSANDDYSSAMAVENVDSLDRTKMHQAIRYAMWKLKMKYPNAKCFVATPIQRKAKEQDVSLRNAIIAMGNRYNFKVIDAEFESGIIRENEVSSGEGVDLYDGLHPNENGAMKMAELYSSVILNAYSFDAKC